MTHTEALRLIVNGQELRVETEPGQSLLHTLRDNAGLTGAKPSCEAGHCGACTVLVDRQPTRACLMPTTRAAGTTVETVEGLAKDGELTPLQQEMLRHGGLQCGFCTPGMVMRATSLLRDEPTADENRIREALGSNLCRCTGYEGIVQAILAARPSAQHRDAIEFVGAMGESIPQRQAVAKVTGKQVYTTDLKLPGMLHARILRSPHAHALVKSIDTGQARQIAGVVDVMTFHDVPEHRYNPAYRNPEDALTLVKDERVLNEKARHQGDRIAAVAAETPRAAAAALAAIKVEWEILSPVLDPEEALAEGAPEIHEGSGNLAAEPLELQFGDVDAGFALADVVVDGTFRTGAVQHANLECKVALCRWEPDGRVTLWSTTQVPFHVRTNVAQALEIPEQDIHVIALDMGGGNGERSDPADEFVVVMLAKRTGRPVRLANNREEQFTSTRTRHAAVVHSRLGATSDGRLTARSTRATIATGAYATMGYRVMYSLGLRSAALYRVDNIRHEGKTAYTTAPVAGGMRGFGSPQAAFAVESQLDELAELLSIDPIDIRVRNLARPGDPYLDLPEEWSIRSAAAAEGLGAVAERVDWARKRRELGKLMPDGMYRGIGVAVGSHISTVMPFYRDHGDATLILRENGHVMIATGVPDTGTGSSTIFCQLAAEVLGLPSDHIFTHSGDTDMSAYDQGAHSSRTTYVAGEAVRRAAVSLREQILEEAGRMLEVSVDDLSLVNGEITVAGAPSRNASVGDVYHWVRYKSDNPRQISAQGSGLPASIAPPQAICIAEVAVDPRTGQVRVEYIYEAIDCGRPVNPQFVHGQLNGGIHMGLGAALSEEMRFDAEGGLLTRSFGDYQLLRAADMPRIETEILESEEPSGPFGAKGLGEASVVPVAPAVANAVAHAIGVRPDRLPLRPDYILDLLAGAPKVSTVKG